MRFDLLCLCVLFWSQCAFIWSLAATTLIIVKKKIENSALIVRTLSTMRLCPLPPGAKAKRRRRRCNKYNHMSSQRARYWILRNHSLAAQATHASALEVWCNQMSVMWEWIEWSNTQRNASQLHLHLLVVGFVYGVYMRNFISKWEWERESVIVCCEGGCGRRAREI